MDVELETVRAGGHAAVEGRQRVLRAERAPAAMREDERPCMIKETHRP
jgi:hypothetical protein